MAELLHQEISQLIQFQTQDPRLQFVTVTGVDITPDLRLARVYVTALGDEADTKKALQGLSGAASYFRYKLGQSLSLRYVPELRFEHDTSLVRGLRIESLLDSLEDETAEEDSAEAEPED
jgi:ribosome-binding factor A